MTKIKKNKKDPFEDLVLDTYEQELEDSIPEDLEVLKINDKERAAFAAAASMHKELKKSKRINIRVNNEDLAKVRAKANKHNIPYQTLLSSLIHKYAEGDLKISL